MGENNTKTKTMKDLTKVFIDLSKCSEAEQKHIFSLLPEPDSPDDYEISDDRRYLRTIGGLWCVIYDTLNRAELTYPEFIKLFEGGEGEKSDLEKLRSWFRVNGEMKTKDYERT